MTLIWVLTKKLFTSEDIFFITKKIREAWVRKGDETMNTYHREIGQGIPTNRNIPVGNITPHYTRHAEEEAQMDMGIMKLPQQIKYEFKDVVEAYVKGGNRVEKYVVRINYDTQKDICFVIKPENNLVLTNWFNMKSDKHTTLQREKYRQTWKVTMNIR